MPSTAFWAVSGGITSVVPTNLRVCFGIENMANEEAVDLELPLAIRVIFGDSEIADNVIAETVLKGEIIQVEVKNGFVQIDNVDPNTEMPVYITFKQEDSYVITIQIIDSDSVAILAENIAIYVAVKLLCKE